LKTLLARAWGVSFGDIVGPGWLDRYYAVQATMPPDTSQAQFRQMLQNLLTERFQLRLHHETRTYPGYQLTVAPGGPKLIAALSTIPVDALNSGNSELDANKCPVLPEGRGQGVVKTGIGGECMRFQGFSIADLVANTTFTGAIRQSDGSTGRVVDKTGLNGKYDFTIRFDAGADSGLVVAPKISGSVPTDDGVGSGLPSLFTAIQRQLGLKLEKVGGLPFDAIGIHQGNPVPLEN